MVNMASAAFHMATVNSSELSGKNAAILEREREREREEKGGGNWLAQ
jgi:hypothetical protein